MRQSTSVFSGSIQIESSEPQRRIPVVVHQSADNGDEVAHRSPRTVLTTGPRLNLPKSSQLHKTFRPGVLLLKPGKVLRKNQMMKPAY
jgi:hypothetical protein